MDNVNVLIELNPTGKMPTKGSEHAAGLDLYADLYPVTSLTIVPGKRVLISAGFKMALPIGYEAQIRPRSGMALKQGIGVLNSPGTIDADYRGDVGVIIINSGEVSVSIEHGQRIAQMVVQRVPNVELKPVNELPTSVRGEGGFGSSGV